MGEAGKREQERRRVIRRNCERWLFPASDAEAAAVREIDGLETFRVLKAPGALLSALGRREGQCHQNALWYARNDPEGRSRCVTGWMVDDENGAFILHSVVEQDGDLFCITPSTSGVQAFAFRPDPDVQWLVEGEVCTFVRKGLALAVGLRRDPERTIAEASGVIERLDRGDRLADILATA